ncbi:glycosyltransferase, MGT family [Catalinimonas alkaloidigena]|uniref:Glycosyltransferase, MGT family n=1 Tax=Catalinimonas alkaloidigena TaxID=1075417 RepID=A0A1G9RA20_9BACT|nr:glycosyltransferase [Catalinimonas alkaloidigena]SDM20159.1 glycosyltransferase, MGT family [Catalinimonas alkaloidigena]
MEPKKILFATFPADGHFNPLTGLAMYLKSQGHDVRWYTGQAYRPKLQTLGIPHVPFRYALDVSSDTLDTLFPERARHTRQLSKLKFDLTHVFVSRTAEYYEDILDLRQEFPFDAMIADIAFTAIPLVRFRLNVPVLAMGIMPLGETSRNLPPSGLGRVPSYTRWGQQKQAVLRWLTDRFVFKAPTEQYRDVLDAYGITVQTTNLFDMLYRSASWVLQSGAPGFEYKRSDLGANIRFVGALLPHRHPRPQRYFFQDRVKAFDKVILVTQGTVEQDVTKIIVPTLEAFKETRHLVVVTTGGSQTEALRTQYPYANVIIEDFIPFEEIMPYTDVYVTNGGYGGVILGLQHGLPLVVAGVHEGKNEINARIGYFKLGINLQTERPTAEQVQDAVLEVLHATVYRTNVKALQEELRQYNAHQLCEQYLAEALAAHEPASQAGLAA